MSIAKSKHASNYTVLPNEIFSSGLPIQAIGLLAYLLSLPHDWVIYKTKLHTQLNMGRERLDTAFKELQEKGYILSIRTLDKNNHFTYNHIVYDKPYNGEPEIEEKHAVSPPTGFQPSDNQPLISTNLQSTKRNNIDIVETVLECLNKEVNARFSAKTPATAKLINARLKEGYCAEDFEAVIKSKAKEWLNDPIMKQYLRPITLFGSKFESYINAARIVSETKKSTSIKPLGEGDEW